MPIDSISDAIPNDSPLIVLGAGALAASAMIAAGQKDASVIVVNPQSGQPGMNTTPSQIMTPADPAAKLDIGTPAVTNAMQGIKTPQMGMNR